MACYGGGHVTIIEPLYQKLKHEYDITILALTVAAPYLDNKAVPYVTFKDFASLFSPSVREFGEALLMGIEQGAGIEYEDSLYYMGCSYFDLVQELGEQRAKERYQKMGRAAFFPEPSLERILNEVQPDVVVATNSVRAERASLSAASKLGIPTLCINDGIWITSGLSGVLDIANSGIADTICVLSHEVKRNLELARYNLHSKVVASGTPVFDSLKHRERRKSDARVTIFYADCHLPESSPQYPGFSGDPTFAESVRYELDSLAERYNWHVIFRMHPNQEVDYSPFKNVTVSERYDSLHEGLAQSDLVVTNISTVGIEGKAFGLGLVSLEGTVYNQYNSFYEAGLSTPIYKASELFEAINAELEKRQDQSPLYDGLAVENIAVEIKKLLCP
jgi:hypothetical protein